MLVFGSVRNIALNIPWVDPPTQQESPPTLPHVYVWESQPKPLFATGIRGGE